MALLLVEGFDKYGPVNSVSANVITLLTQGEWTSVIGSAHTIAAPLSATGYTLNLGINSSLAKTLSASYGRLIGGFRFNSNLGNTAGIAFQDAGTDQAAVTINSTGAISVRNGSVQAGTILGTSTATVTAGTTHYVEFDITFGNPAAYQVWLDGVSVLSGSGDTTTTANNSANGITLRTSTSVSFTVDDFYLLDATGPAPLNAVLLTSPRIETQFPVSDGAVQFAVGAAVLGSTLPRITGNAFSSPANALYVVPLTPAANCTITSVGFLCASGNATVQLRPVLYADSSGAPGTLLSSGATSVGATAGIIKTLPLTTSQSLVAGTRYWLGAMNDVSFINGYAGMDSSAVGRSASATFASGAPSTAPAMTGGQNTTVVFGIVTPPGNFYTQQQNPVQGANSYVYDATVGHEDLYNFPPLSVVPSAIYGTAIKASVSKSDAGAKTVSVRQKSGSTDSAGSAGTQAPGTSYAWITSLFPTDPNTGAGWTLAALNAAQAGLRIES